MAIGGLLLERIETIEEKIQKVKTGISTELSFDIEELKGNVKILEEILTLTQLTKLEISNNLPPQTR